MRFSLHSVLSLSKIFKKIKSKLRPGKTNTLQIRRCLALPEGLCHQFSLAEIKAATNNFHQDMIIAKGDTGFIFRGLINDQLYTIKRLTPSSTNSLLPIQELRCAARFLCQLRHRNIVSLIGYCEERGEMIHVYEHVKNGSLYDHLHNKSYDPLPWKQRLEICIGVARALHYLHTGARFGVIHRDVSSKNILLDDQWRSKLHNFGFARRGPHSMSNDPISVEIETDIAYTFACMAPEGMITYRLSDKSDVYSFGVVLFEVLCCRRVYDAELEEEQRSLVRWACTCIENETIYDIIDPYLKGNVAPECFKKFLDIAYSCVRFEPDKRPTMGEVEMTLELALELALELQKKADSEMESINPQGECIFEEA